MTEIKGIIVDIFNQKLFPGKILIEDGKIKDITDANNVPKQYILPGFIDAHVHIESSMLVPTRFSELSMKHGTIATVSDPHEIANVLGIGGVEFMIENARNTPQRLFFGAPSCVPATNFETSGAVLGVEETDYLLKKDEIYFLAEMMNFPGVIYEDKEVIGKLELAKKYNKPVDGHAPMLTGDDLKKYAEAGISTDHECTSIEEAEEKIALGMKILIRNGSAAKDFDVLYPLIDKYPDKVMFCTDDCHPDDLLEGHINTMVKEAIHRGCNIFNVLQAACVNPVLHYDIPVGLLRKGDTADFIVVDDFRDFKVKEMYINGVQYVENYSLLYKSPVLKERPNNFNIEKIKPEDIKLSAKSNKAKVITAKDRSLLTGFEIHDIKIKNGFAISDPENDILKIVVVNRYQKAKPIIGFIKGFGLKHSAIATSVAHDSHNIIAVGTDDEKIADAINRIIEARGGMCFVGENETEVLELPVAGLMTDANPEETAEKYKKLTQKAIKSGSLLNAPFMTLSFMALLVIPQLKIGDKGLFDVNKFQFTEVFV